MSSRSLMHYFSPGAPKPPALSSPDESEIVEVTPTLPEAGRKRSQRASKTIPSAHDTDDDFDNEPILPPQNGNSITKYFSAVDKATALKNAKKKRNSCVVTVEAMVHGSPKKQSASNASIKKIQKKKKKKTGITSAQADYIELVSSEEVMTDSPSPELIDIKQPCAELVTESISILGVVEKPALPKAQTSKVAWKMKIQLGESAKISDEEIEESCRKDGPRRSTRIRIKPLASSCESEEEEPKRVAKKRRKKEEEAGNPDSSLEIVAEEIAPLFLRKKRQEEWRVVKKARQDFLFSGVPEVLRQQTAAKLALEQRPVEIFPRISHVTQAGSEPWQIPFPVQLSAILRTNPPSYNIRLLPAFPANLIAHDTISSTRQSIFTPQTPYLEWRQCKEWITRLKEDYSLSFPFFRTLRTLLPKSGGDDALWTDVYAPKQSSDVLGTNRKPAQQLKNWLNQWKLKAGEEVKLAPKKKKDKKTSKRKRLDSDGSDPDEVIDDKSNGSWSSETEQLCNCLLLVGPTGCGKTATVYALAEELGYNILEVNASSRRNGKTVLSHLHEATQSHSVNNNIAAANTISKFFGGKAAPVAAAKTKPTEIKATMSLMLFEDVDIVFETEDESFYSALTTLIQTSKRPVIMTLGSIEERALVNIQDKIKGDFDVLFFESLERPIACGYLWSVCLVEGYPLDWNALDKWIASKAGLDLDIRSLLLELQFLLDQHRLKLKLNFNQLQLKNEEEPSNGVQRPPNDKKDSGSLQLIELPVSEICHDLPYASDAKTARFVYDADQDVISAVGSKRKEYSRILSNDTLYDSEATEGVVEISEAPPCKSSRWRGDMSQLVRCLDFRAANDLIRMQNLGEEVSWSDATLIQDIQQFVTDLSTKLIEKDFAEVSAERRQDKMPRLRDIESTRTGNHILLQSSLSRGVLLQRKSNATDMLPYLRSCIRSDLERGLGKRRRKPRSRIQSPTVRLPSLDLVLPTSSVMQLANDF